MGLYEMLSGTDATVANIRAKNVAKLPDNVV